MCFFKELTRALSKSNESNIGINSPRLNIIDKLDHGGIAYEE